MPSPCRRLALLLLGSSPSLLAVGVRHYEVYEPRFQRGYIIEASAEGLPYNHCPTLMWLQDRWICAWNGNERAQICAPCPLAS